MDYAPNIVIQIIGSFLGLSLGIFLLFTKSSRNTANIFLGTFLILFTGYLIPAAVYRMGHLENLPHLVYIQFPTSLVTGQLVYLYVRACTEKNFQMKPILWLHFLPLVIGMVYYMPFFLQSGEEKVAYYIRLLEERETGVPAIINITLGLITAVYYVFSIRLIQQYKKYLNNEASSIDHTYLRWLWFFSAMALLPIAFICFWTFFAKDSALAGVLVVSVLFILYMGVYLVVLFKPQIFHAFPHQIKVETVTEEQKQKYESSNLKEEQKERFVEKVKQYVEHEKAYQESELTLSYLSEKVNIPAHYLSQVINEKLDCTFLDFINNYRVEYAKEKLKSADYQQFTIISIAYEAGFNSKSAFYAAFKKFAGTTPSAYRKASVVKA